MGASRARAGQPVRGTRLLMPLLKDAVFTELHGIYSLRYVQERGYDLPIVNDRLLQITERVLGSGIVKSVQIRGLSKRVPQTG